jgi:hypothetical protein
MLIHVSCNRIEKTGSGGAAGAAKRFKQSPSIFRTDFCYCGVSEWWPLMKAAAQRGKVCRFATHLQPRKSKNANVGQSFRGCSMR